MSRELFNSLLGAMAQKFTGSVTPALNALSERRNGAYPARNWKFESISLQRRVTRTQHSGRSLDLTGFKSSL
jgi:hypothetical protein